MGSKTLNDIFYKPDIGASGAVEKGKFDDGLDVADGLIEANKPANNKLSALAVTTSAELAGKISDEMGAGKLRFDTSVTAKTAIATLNVNEAGIILVSCAVTPYTITLPTPIGNTGLKYKIKKTDYNYNLITFATVAGKFDFANDDGVLKDTYTRVNTPGAEVVFVSDGANWQVIDEAIGQVPFALAYSSAQQDNVPMNTEIRVDLGAEGYDIGNNFDLSIWVSGTADGNTESHLVDDGNSQFTDEMIGCRVKNTTDSTFAWIIARTDAGDVTLDWDAFPLGTENYEIKYSKFVVPVAGYYLMSGRIGYTGVVANKYYQSRIHKNSVLVDYSPIVTSSTIKIITQINTTKYFSVADIIELWTMTNSASTSDIRSGGWYTFLSIRLISKD